MCIYYIYVQIDIYESDSYFLLGSKSVSALPYESYSVIVNILSVRYDTPSRHHPFYVWTRRRKMSLLGDRREKGNGKEEPSFPVTGTRGCWVTENCLILLLVLLS